MTLSAFETFRIVTGLKLHFNAPSYDYTKYSGKSGLTKITEQKFESRADNVFFQKLAKHKDCFNFILANVVEDRQVQIRQLAYSDKCDKVYHQWLKRQESLTYIFKSQVNKIDDLKHSFRFSKQNHPKVFQMYLKDELSLETICILLDVIGVVPIWDKKMQDDMVWINEGQKIKKYTPFLPKDKTRFKKIIVEKLHQSVDK